MECISKCFPIANHPNNFPFTSNVFLCTETPVNNDDLFPCLTYLHYTHIPFLFSQLFHLLLSGKNSFSLSS